jgi:uncharacterized protein YbjT (DUF2867 family)
MIFVTGSTGHVGSHVLRLLGARGAAVRVGVRPRRAGAWLDASTSPLVAGAETVPFDFLDSATYGPAVQGCDAVFLLRPPAIANTRRTLNPFLDVARQHGVRQVVFISVMGAGSNPLVPHHAVEKHLQAGPAGWTILRPGFFAQNLASAYREDICRDNRIYVPAGAAQVAFIDAHDIAEVAAAALLNPLAHADRTYTMTGPQALSFDAVAALLSSELGRPIHYQPASVVGYVRHLHQSGLPAAQTMVQTVLHVGLRMGQARRVTPQTADLLGRPASTMRRYVQRERALWLPPALEVAAPSHAPSDRRHAA